MRAQTYRTYRTGADEAVAVEVLPTKSVGRKVADRYRREGMRAKLMKRDIKADCQRITVWLVLVY